jgi:thiol-disulfide isomerase/thioredoxin
MTIIRVSAVWCSSCLVTYSSYAKLKEKYPKCEFIELDYDLDDVAKYHVGDILPVVILMDRNKEVTRVVGESNLKEIEEYL